MQPGQPTHTFSAVAISAKLKPLHTMKLGIVPRRGRGELNGRSYAVWIREEPHGTEADPRSGSGTITRLYQGCTAVFRDLRQVQSR